MRCSSSQPGSLAKPRSQHGQSKGGAGGVELASGLVSGLAPEVAVGPLPSSPSTRLLFCRLIHGPQSQCPGLRLRLRSTGDSHELRNQWALGGEAPEDRRGAGREPQASSTELPCTPWVEGASSGSPGVAWGCPGDRGNAGCLGSSGVPCSPSSPRISVTGLQGGLAAQGLTRQHKPFWSWWTRDGF